MNAVLDLYRLRPVTFLATIALLGSFGLSSTARPASAQDVLDRGVTGAALTLRQLDGVKRVLMIGAHPDDEDTSLLTVLARGQGAETAYLSLTRGDGGQNLIGPELFEGLGVVRTGELVAARRLDGGRQFFTRAFDYGFSKSADEAFGKWPREELLRDVVWVVRTFRPQVIISVFSGTPADGHGQHQAAGIMAREVFEAAADPARFPEQFERGVEPWQASKLFQSHWGIPEGESFTVETGAYDPVMGRSNYQLAMDSRSQHRSQDMGQGQPFGPRGSEVTLVATAPGLNVSVSAGLFAGVDTTLAGQVVSLPASVRDDVSAALVRYRGHVDEAGTLLSAVDPALAAPPLGAALMELDVALARADGSGNGEGFVATLGPRRGRVTAALLDAAGIVVRAVADDDLVVPGDTVEVTVETWNGGPFPIAEVRPRLLVPSSWHVALFSDGVAETVLEPGAVRRDTYRVAIPSDADVSRLYFREAPRDGEMYRWPDDSARWALPFSPPIARASVEAVVTMPEVGPVPFQVQREVRYLGVDKALGEFTRPLLVVPAVSVASRPAVTVWPAGLSETRDVNVEVRGEAAHGVGGSLSLDVPTGWLVEPASIPFAFGGPGESRSATFRVTPDGPTEGRHVFRAVATLDDRRVYDEGYSLIEYPHIERTAFFDAAETRVTVVPVRVAEGVRVGYIMGSGDDGALALRQLGVEVEVVTPEQIQAGDFSRYDALVLGIRVYETRPDVAAANDGILEFVRGGGTVVVQYNKYEYPAGGFAPYEVAMLTPAQRGAPRVTDEGSPVAFVDPQSPVIRGPNTLTEHDFEGWVQERGLHFLAAWDEAFEPQLEFVDPGEEPTRGSLLVAPYGQGLYVYTGISFFRQFPAGVAGAYRLFANLVSLRAGDWR
jgi:LmbE family N-acetylglucosaminyl deacetylase